MAFDQTDTEQIYDNVIRPILIKNGVNPIIINRREDNRDINVQIIDQLNKCDFCIVDLTYTRPSVYFEAGYAQRNVEVIYTVRSDHLRRNQPEDRRVHFDLQMKPLLKWKNPNDRQFPGKLERRLKGTVLKKLEQTSRENKKLQEEKQNFCSLSVNERIKILKRTSIYAFCKARFNNWTLAKFAFGRFRTYSNSPRSYKNPAMHVADKSLIFIAKRRQKRRMIVISIGGFEKLHLTKLREINANYVRYNYVWGHIEDEVEKVGITDEHHIFLSLAKTPNSRIMSAMPDLTFQGNPQRYVANRKYSKYSGATFQRKVNLYFISDIDSKTKLKEHIDEIINSI